MRNRTTAAPLLLALFLLVVALPVRAQEVVDEDVNAAIRRHGLEQSRVMALMGWLTDVHGPRLTGSPALMQASMWAVEQLEGWGCAVTGITDRGLLPLQAKSYLRRIEETVGELLRDGHGHAHRTVISRTLRLLLSLRCGGIVGDHQDGALLLGAQRLDQVENAVAVVGVEPRGRQHRWLK